MNKNKLLIVASDPVVDYIHNSTPLDSANEFKDAFTQLVSYLGFINSFDENGIIVPTDNNQIKDLLNKTNKIINDEEGTIKDQINSKFKKLTKDNFFKDAPKEAQAKISSIFLTYQKENLDETPTTKVILTKTSKGKINQIMTELTGYPINSYPLVNMKVTLSFIGISGILNGNKINLHSSLVPDKLNKKNVHIVVTEFSEKIDNTGN